MGRMFAATMLSVVLLLTVCAKEDKQANTHQDVDSNKSYRPPQTGVSKEYLDSRLQSEELFGRKNELPQSLNYDYSSIWLKDTSNDYPQYGVIGIN